MDQITQLQQRIKDSNSLHINSDLLNYTGIVEYYPEELVMTVRAGTTVKEIQAELEKHNQTLLFYVEDISQSIGAVYAQGGADVSDAVLGVRIIDGRGDVLNFGGQVMKNVAGYDVSRLLVGSKGQLALVLEISFKVMPSTTVKTVQQPNQPKPISALHKRITQNLKRVFDPNGVFS